MSSRDFRDRGAHEELAHVSRFSGRIKPLLEPARVAHFEKLIAPGGSGITARSDLAQYLELAEEQVLTFRKPEHNGRHLLFVASDTGGWIGISKLVELACQSEDVGQVSCYAAGAALHDGLRKSRLAALFHRVKDPAGSGSLYASLCALNDTAVISHRPVDTVVVTAASFCGPETVALYSAKSILGAARLFLVMEAWGNLGDAFRNNPGLVDQIDGICCNDRLAKLLIQEMQPLYDPDRILVTGTGQIEPERLAADPAKQADTRRRLGLHGREVVVLWAGDYYYPACGLRKTFNLDTRDKTIAAASAAARANPQRSFVMLIRPHPADSEHARAADVSKYIGLLPPNLRLVEASHRICDMAAAAGVSHVIASIGSTETFKVPYTGSRGVFLVFDEPGLGGPLYRQIYAPHIRREIERQPGIAVAFTEADLQQCISSIEPQDRNEIGPPVLKPSEAMLKVILQF